MASKLVHLHMTSMAVPHGGQLVNTLLKDENAKKAAINSCDFELELDERQLCDVELLMQGGFSPLTGYMDEPDYLSVVNDMKLSNGLIFGLPVVYDTNNDRVVPGAKVLLSYQGTPIAKFDVSSKYTPNKPVEAKNCYRTTSIEHPAVYMITAERGRYYCGGKITGLNVPKREFPCKSPEEVRSMLPSDSDVVAFQCRNPIHRAHYELFTRALDDKSLRPGAVVLVHPTCGPTQPDDIPGTVRYKTYEVLKEQTNNPKIFWAYLPYSMHMAGPREAIQHMIIRKNYGCTHFIIGRDMAGCKSSITGE
jgi:sulfate adenylyltransferase